MMWLQLIQSQGRISTTKTIQFTGFMMLAAILLLSVLLGRENASELYMTFAAYCGGLTISKGVVNKQREQWLEMSQEIKGQVEQLNQKINAQGGAHVP